MDFIMILNLKRVKIFFDILTSEGKAVYKSRDICPRELKLEKKKNKQNKPTQNLVLTRMDFQLLGKIGLEYSGAQGSD